MSIRSPSSPFKRLKISHDDLFEKRVASVQWLESVWSDLEHKYSNMEDDDDEIDLNTMQIIHNRGSVTNMRARPIGSFQFARATSIPDDDSADGSDGSDGDTDTVSGDNRSNNNSESEDDDTVQESQESVEDGEESDTQTETESEDVLIDQEVSNEINRTYHSRLQQLRSLQAFLRRTKTSTQAGFPPDYFGRTRILDTDGKDAVSTDASDENENETSEDETRFRPKSNDWTRTPMAKRSDPVLPDTPTPKARARYQPTGPYQTPPLSSCSSTTSYASQSTQTSADSQSIRSSPTDYHLSFFTFSPASTSRASVRRTKSFRRTQHLESDADTSEEGECSHQKALLDKFHHLPSTPSTCSTLKTRDTGKGKARAMSPTSTSESEISESDVSTTLLTRRSAFNSDSPKRIRRRSRLQSSPDFTASPRCSYVTPARLKLQSEDGLLLSPEPELTVNKAAPDGEVELDLGHGQRHSSPNKRLRVPCSDSDSDSTKAEPYPTSRPLSQSPSKRYMIRKTPLPGAARPPDDDPEESDDPLGF